MTTNKLDFLSSLHLISHGLLQSTKQTKDPFFIDFIAKNKTKYVLSVTKQKNEGKGRTWGTRDTLQVYKRRWTSRKEQKEVMGLGTKLYRGLEEGPSNP